MANCGLLLAFARRGERVNSVGDAFRLGNRSDKIVHASDRSRPMSNVVPSAISPVHGDAGISSAVFTVCASAAPFRN